ncbi:hypothetical protein MLD38_033452 [Melastoma candidum]|uniref:Uncharacterized protein n=1 Tax=Melastoma candidum TaxID=119954 RepID=A0ACB9M7C7_9MYRT|nr:hypothetical protein MLD38_033452 [Melastoma candidum]
MTDHPDDNLRAPRRLHLAHGQYLGEISALCFLRLPSPAPFPLLLAGSGSSVTAYDVEQGVVVGRFRVFDGIRVHGISCRRSAKSDGDGGSLDDRFEFMVAVYGEKRVKLFDLSARVMGGKEPAKVFEIDMVLISTLPRFWHWVLDVSFLKHEGSLLGEGDAGILIAVGCTDNSVRLWSVENSCIVLEVSSPESCLLYSMRLWGENIDDLRIASGTIFNEILVWKVVSQLDSLPLVSITGEKGSMCPLNGTRRQIMHYDATHICKLVGHEGSIYRIAWSCDGSKLITVSDDRSARIWVIDCTRECSFTTGESRRLFGHSARVWDCFIYDNVIITAGEDCSCRVWGEDGKQLRIMKEHIGRGIWRCLYDPVSSILVTGGFDSSIKVYRLPATLGPAGEVDNTISDQDHGTELFSMVLPSSSGMKLVDSKSEYVRCLYFSREDVLYVATNHGYLYHVKLSKPDDVTWSELVRVSHEVPIICIDLLAQMSSESTTGHEDWVAVGDGKGKVTIVRVVTTTGSVKVESTFSWMAEMDRQLLGVFWCGSLGPRFLFTANPRGALKLWAFDEPLQSLASDARIGRCFDVFLLAEFTSSLKVRLMCLDASLEEEVLVCGDLRGNLTVYPLSRGLLLEKSAKSDVGIFPINHFKGAHGISAISNISIASVCSSRIEIHSTGADGCICYLEYDKVLQNFMFVGMKQLKELSLVESVSADAKTGSYAIGFASADFVIWNITSETKVVQVTCGGWRRPHSFYLGDVPERMNCFAYVKDEVINIRRLWMAKMKGDILPRNLGVQFHGREVHSLCFIHEVCKKRPAEESCWLVTGCEDGTVRLTRYSPYEENWSSSKMLGGHVGGSAVRSICCVSALHMHAPDAYNPDGNGDAQVEEGLSSTYQSDAYPVLLISVGAKRVLTSWVLRDRRSPRQEGRLSDTAHGDAKSSFLPSADLPSTISFQWLSSDMPVKYSVPPKNRAEVNLPAKDDKISPLKATHFECSEDDWRYLAVTAFLVRHVGSRSTVCFVVVSCSDATLTIRALVLPNRLWFDVALMVPLASPVLSLQHLIVPHGKPLEGSESSRNSYMVISGSTDGSVAFWDLTKTIDSFMQRLANISLDKLVNCPKRPRTGRGSQGGRWWRSLGGGISRNRQRNSLAPENVEQKPDEKILEHFASEASPSANCAACESESKFADFALEISEVHPMHILNGFHQSGANCLHVSRVPPSEHPDVGSLYQLVSGGDDQAVCCLRFEIKSLSTDPDRNLLSPDTGELIVKSEDKTELPQKRQIGRKSHSVKIISQEKVCSAHSSAVKGVWTDGTWVFSTGLDQRVRCWVVEEQGRPKAVAHFITSVPEPEALDVRAFNRDKYHVAVAGRGMQMIEFSAAD